MRNRVFDAPGTVVKLLSASPEEAKQVRIELSPFVEARSDDEELLRNLGQAVQRCLPSAVLSVVSSISNGTGPALALIQGLAEEVDLPGTPSRAPTSSDTQLHLLSEVVLLGIAKILGEPLAYRAEKNGALIQSVFPVETERDAPSNESSSRTLDLHTELVFSRRNPDLPLDAASPDFILLWCLRSDPDHSAATLVATVDELCANLQPADLRILGEPRFELRAPYSFTRDEPANRPWVGPVPIFRLNGRDRLAAFDLACGTRGIDEEASLALLSLRESAKAPGIIRSLHLVSGDLLLLDNRRCAHGRSHFAARFDGTDRWLLRLYVRRSLAGMAPIDPRSSPRIL